MQRIIKFKDAFDLGEFLKGFTGSTALFTCQKFGDEWVLEFTGGF